MLPVDAVAHAWDESGKEHEVLPVGSLFGGDTTHITVGPTVSLKGKGDMASKTVTVELL